MSEQLDLPLLRAFVAIYETGSVTLAGERLFVTQPSVSYALKKLRETLADQLFIRSDGTMTPTPRARDCYELFSSALVQIENALEQSKQFVPAESTRRFRIALSDIGEMIFLPPIFNMMQQRAPKTELEVVQVAAEDLPGWLASGKLDAAVGHLPSICNQTNHATILHERYVCLCRKGHPLVGRKLTLKTFTSSAHVFVSSKFSGHKEVEGALRTAGMLRKVALQVPHFTILPLLISTNDLLVVMPSRVAALFQTYEPLRSLPLPIDIPTIEVRVHWDRRHESNPAQRWFIDLIRESLQSI
jgi:DNA-binding transcriptional LysR family regulator